MCSPRRSGRATCSAPGVRPPPSFLSSLSPMPIVSGAPGHRNPSQDGRGADAGGIPRAQPAAVAVQYRGRAGADRRRHPRCYCWHGYRYADAVLEHEGPSARVCDAAGARVARGLSLQGRAEPGRVVRHRRFGVGIVLSLILARLSLDTPMPIIISQRLPRGCSRSRPPCAAWRRSAPSSKSWRSTQRACSSAEAAPRCA